MKRSASLLFAAGLTLALLGCSAAKDAGPVTATGDTTTSAAPGADVTLVSLKVPNMFCGACAASVRDDLEKIDGAKEITTDVPGRLATFKLTKPDVDYKTELATFAESNTHLAGYEIE